MRLAWNVARMGRKGMHVGFWWGNREGKAPLGRPRRGLDNIKMYLREI
jgi:hypothetical protein